jgi:ATP-dependent helicase HrpB
MRAFRDALPIDEALPGLCAALLSTPSAVLVAPPGAGKTTRVPLALLDESWVDGRRIILLEPRRLAARGAAQRMATELGEQVGDTIGIRMRLGTKVSRRTRIEVVTEGVFSRMILDDPTLDGIAAVLFDEFHERSLDADTGLAFALESQGALRDDLRLLVMSATLDAAPVAALMGDCPVITSQGRAFPVETRHLPRQPGERIEDAMTRAIGIVLASETGSILAFLPGQGEILRTASRLSERRLGADIDIAPLFGQMDQADQVRAVAPAAPGRRKVVLATSIAETSLTIEGVRVVVDSGLARVPVYEPDLGLTSLATVRASRAAVDQRRGRAGRTQAGICYRLWEEGQTGALEPYTRPEILASDLAPLLLDAAEWGEPDPERLKFLDAPPAPALKEARDLLRQLHAIDAGGRITPMGRTLRKLPLPPRLARMVVEGARRGAGRLATDIAVLLVERGLGGNVTDLSHRLAEFRRDRGGRAQDMRRLSDGWLAQLPASPDMDGSLSAGQVLALAYPDRVARRRDKGSAFVMVSGRAAEIEPADALSRSPYLAIADVGGEAGRSRIRLAAPLAEEEVVALAGDDLVEVVEASFDPAVQQVRTRFVRRWGALVLAESPRQTERDLTTARALAEGLLKRGRSGLPWTKGQEQLLDRIQFLRDSGETGLPELGSDALLASAEDWLVPALTGRIGRAEITPGDLDAALDALLTWPQRQLLEREAPTHFTAPTGSRLAVDYAAEGGPSVAVRVQELFGLSSHPTLANGRIPLVLHLLSPAHRPIQITRDLPGFWKGSWAAVKSEMKGRYPRHVWPDDPAAAAATTRAKPRGT